MKKITFAITLFSFAVQAQMFPSPYCEITDAGDVSVEEITTVDFAGTSILNTDTASVLVDETATVAAVNRDETYTFEVAGNTYDTGGNAFDNDIVAFIDWNQNDVLDDAGEVYSIGTITGSTGSDGQSVMLAISIPTDAILGTTRVRITKTYQDPDSPAVINPCAIEFNPFGFGPFAGYGQALDFTLDVGPVLSVNEFDLNALTVYPTPIKDVLYVNYKSVISAVAIYNLLGQEVYTKKTAFTNLQLDLSSLVVGTYIATLTSEKGQHSFRIIKQ